jgi:hypothetical protein
MLKKMDTILKKNRIFFTHKNYDFVTAEIDRNLQRLILGINVVTPYVSSYGAN